MESFGLLLILCSPGKTARELGPKCSSTTASLKSDTVLLRSYTSDLKGWFNMLFSANANSSLLCTTISSR